MQTEIVLPLPKFNEIEKISSVQSICESNSARGTAFINGKEFVFTGSMSSAEHGYYWISGIECIELVKYTGKLKPLPYRLSLDEADAGRRARGYDGMLITHAGRALVLTGPEIKFLPSQAGKQTALF